MSNTKFLSELIIHSFFHNTHPKNPVAHYKRMHDGTSLHQNISHLYRTKSLIKASRTHSSLATTCLRLFLAFW